MWSKDWSWDIEGSSWWALWVVAHQHALRCPLGNSLQMWFQIQLLWAHLAKWFCCWDLGQKAVSQPLNGIAVVMLPSNPPEPKLLNFQSLQALSASLQGKYRSFTCFYTGFTQVLYCQAALPPDCIAWLHHFAARWAVDPVSPGRRTFENENISKISSF